MFYQRDMGLFDLLKMSTCFTVQKNMSSYLTMKSVLLVSFL